MSEDRTPPPTGTHAGDRCNEQRREEEPTADDRGDAGLAAVVIERCRSAYEQRDLDADRSEGDARAEPLRRKAAGDRIEPPRARHALQLVLAAVLEREARAGDEISYRARHEHLARARERGHARADVDSDAANAVA